MQIQVLMASQHSTVAVPVLNLYTGPYVDSGVERIDPFCFLAGCCKRQLNQALSVLSLSLGVFECVLCC